MTEVFPDDGFTYRLKEVVEMMGSAEKLAKSSHMSARNIGKYLTGTDPSRKRLISISKAAGVNLLWLATGEGPKKTEEAEGKKTADSRLSGYEKLMNKGLGSGTEESAQPHAWFHEWIEEELKGRSMPEIMAIAVKIKMIVDEDKGG